MGAEGAAALILAAGFSSRMGELKPLLPLGGRYALDRVIGAYLCAGVGDIWVVLGHRGEEIAARLFFREEVTFVENADYAQGMLSSLRCGVAGLPPERKMFFLHPADIAGVAAATPARLWRRHQESGGPLLYPAYAGERGHPILVAAAIGREILRGDWPDGFRGLLGHYRGEEVAVADPNILRDMDTPAEYRALAASCPQWDPLAFVAELLARTSLPPHLRAHCDGVAAVALGLAKALNRRGHSFHEAAVYAAGRVHDLAKGERGHAAVGRERLLAAGQPELAILVGAHMGDGIDPKRPLAEKDLLFLADKMVMGDRFVGVAGRFAAAYGRFGDLPALREREAKARAIAAQIAACGVDAEKVAAACVPGSPEINID